MVDQDLLDLLVCPDTRQPVRHADADLLERLNQAIDAGTVTNRAGETVRDRLGSALVREDGALVYPIRDDIPIMLIDQAIPVPGAPDSNPRVPQGR